jgi:hypothetical protein
MWRAREGLGLTAWTHMQRENEREKERERESERERERERTIDYLD